MRTLSEVLASVLIGVRILVLALLSVARCSEEKDLLDQEPSRSRQEHGLLFRRTEFS